jgi:D-alanyl-D-alanine carboxypeptidase/D-alanyl-D-alanine-endopeptidase (penicillin-binding protein 4)
MVAGGAAPHPGSASSLRFTNDVDNADGSHTVAITGDVPLGSTEFRAYRVLEPARFAEMAFAKALQEKGISVMSAAAIRVDFPALATLYTDKHLVAEHVSPPLSTEVQVMMKASSNLHTGIWPYVYGAIAGHEREDAKLAGNRFKSALFRAAGLDPETRGISEDRFTPDFFVKFLAYMMQQPYFAKYREALPILGKDGSLARIQSNLPAAGHVYAKTGTGLFARDGAPTQIVKALAGYIELPGGRWMPFAAFVDFHAAGLTQGMMLTDQAGDALGEIASVAYETLSSQGLEDAREPQ